MSGAPIGEGIDWNALQEAVGAGMPYEIVARFRELEKAGMAGTLGILPMDRNGQPMYVVGAFTPAGGGPQQFEPFAAILPASVIAGLSPPVGGSG